MKKLIIFIFCCSLTSSIFSQTITYSEFDNSTLRSLQNFNIIGKIKDNTLIYKNIDRSHYKISVYNKSMQLKEDVDLSFLPQRIVYWRFIPYTDFMWFIYVYQKGNTSYCMGVKMDENAKLLNTPVTLDSTRNKPSLSQYQSVYSVIHSEDKSKIMIYKVQIDYGQMKLSGILFNNSLKILDKSESIIWYDHKTDFFSNFSLTNQGDWIFTREKRPDQLTYPGGYILDAQLYIKHYDVDTFTINNLALAGKLLEQLNLKVNNLNRKIMILSFYSSKVNIEGLYTTVWNEDEKKFDFQNLTQLGDQIIKKAKTETSDLANALNNYIIRDIVLKNNGGFILVSEDITTQYSSLPNDNSTRSSSLSLYDPYQRYNFSHSYKDELESVPRIPATTTIESSFNNILILDADSSGNLSWGNIIPKTQNQMNSNSDNLSFAMLLNQDQLTFLYNKLGDVDNETRNNNISGKVARKKVEQTTISTLKYP